LVLEKALVNIIVIQMEARDNVKYLAIGSTASNSVLAEHAQDYLNAETVCKLWLKLM